MTKVNKIIAGVMIFVITLLVGTYIGDKYGISILSIQALSSHAMMLEEASGSGSCPRWYTEIGRFTARDGSTVAVCQRGTNGRILLYTIAAG